VSTGFCQLPPAQRSADDIHLYLVSSPLCVIIAAPTKVARHTAKVARSAIAVMEKIIYFSISINAYLCQ
jgi:hypothetical protein